jgi:hypothetical protein
MDVQSTADSAGSYILAMNVDFQGGLLVTQEIATLLTFLPNAPSASQGDTVSVDSLLDALPAGVPISKSFFLGGLFNTQQDVNNKQSSARPDAQLAENIGFKVFPNPGNANSNIRFTLQQPQQVQVRVLDMTGRVVSQPAEGQLAAGEHRFDLCADCGSTMSEGLYMVQIQVGNRHVSRKFVAE